MSGAAGKDAGVSGAGSSCAGGQASGPASASGAIRLGRQAVDRPWGGERVAPAMGWEHSGKVGEWWLLSCYVSAEPKPGAAPDRDVSRIAAGDGATGDGTAGDGGARGDGTASGDSATSASVLLTDWLDGPGAPRGPDGAPLLPGGGDFPLLLKFLDTSAVLSVQVHPDDRAAAVQQLPNGKTEAWHVLAAEPTACLFVGTAPEVSSAELLDAVEAGVDPVEMARLLRRVPAVPGETWLVEAGTIHAVGPGVSLFEIQQTSDATWRIYDWEREPAREVHLAQARVAARDLPEAHPAPPPGDLPGWHPVVRCAAFALHHGRVAGALDLPTDLPWGAVTVLAGAGSLHAGGVEHTLTSGDTLLTWGPAQLRGDDLTVLLSTAAG